MSTNAQLVALEGPRRHRATRSRAHSRTTYCRVGGVRQPDPARFDDDRSPAQSSCPFGDVALRTSPSLDDSMVTIVSRLRCPISARKTPSRKLPRLPAVGVGFGSGRSEVLVDVRLARHRRRPLDRSPIAPSVARISSMKRSVSASCSSSASNRCGQFGQLGEVAVLGQRHAAPVGAVLRRQFLLGGVRLDDVGQGVRRRSLQHVLSIAAQVSEGVGVGHDGVGLRIESDVGREGAEQGQVSAQTNADSAPSISPAATAAAGMSGGSTGSTPMARARSSEASEAGTRSLAPWKSAVVSNGCREADRVAQGLGPDGQALGPRGVEPASISVARSLAAISLSRPRSVDQERRLQRLEGADVELIPDACGHDGEVDLALARPSRPTSARTRRCTGRRPPTRSRRRSTRRTISTASANSSTSSA